MKTLALTSKKAISKLGILALFFIAFCSFSTVYGQETAQNERTIKGVISDEKGPIDGATIILKNTKIGTASNSKGEFTFPKPLKSGDILLITYLGYKNQELKIDDKTSLYEIMLTEDVIEFTGAPNTNKPYKSKRSK